MKKLLIAVVLAILAGYITYASCPSGGAYGTENDCWSVGSCGSFSSCYWGLCDCIGDCEGRPCVFVRDGQPWSGCTQCSPCPSLSQSCGTIFWCESGCLGGHCPPNCYCDECS